MATVAFRGSREQVRILAMQLRDILTGDAPDPKGIAKGFMLAIGFAALSDIKAAYIVKARGGTDEAGITWAKLSPVTIANRRVGKKDRDTSPDIKEREKIRKREFKKFFARFQLTMDQPRARALANQQSQIAATRQTGKSKVETLGFRDVEILRDTSVLINSLSPGVMSGVGPSATYSKPSSDGGDQQIFDLRRAEVIVGTNVPYAATHQHGDDSRRIPARPFLPEPEAIPEVWWQRWLDVSVKALAAGAALHYREAA